MKINSGKDPEKLESSRFPGIEEGVSKSQLCLTLSVQPYRDIGHLTCKVASLALGAMSI